METEMERERYGRGRKSAPTSPSPQRCTRTPKPRAPVERPAFDTTPFDSSKGASAWETLPTKSIFDSEPTMGKRTRSTGWLSAPYPEDSRRTARQNVSSAGPSNLLFFPYSDDCDPQSAPSTSSADSHSPPRRRTAPRGKSVASPMLKKVLTKSATSRASTRASGLDYSPGPSCSSQAYSPGPSGSSQAGCNELEPDFRYAYPYAMMMFGEDDDDLREWFAKSKRQKVDTTPLPPWKPYYASERLEDPNNPPPMFHPAFNNDWRCDPNVSDDMRNLYASSLNQYSSNFCIFDYGKLSEYNTLNVYAPEKLLGFNEEGLPTGPCLDDSSEVFGDPYEALARPTPPYVRHLYRPEKYQFSDKKQRLELFRELCMGEDTEDTSGRDVEGACYDDILEEMEELCSPSNEGRRAFWEAMANPPPIRDECFDDGAASGFTTADSLQGCSESESSLLNTTFIIPDASDRSFPEGVGPGDDC